MRVGREGPRKGSKSSMETNYEKSTGARNNGEDTGACVKAVFGKIVDLLGKLCRIRLLVRKNGTVKKEFPLVLCLVFAAVSLKLTSIAVLISLLAGYTFDLRG